MVMVNVLHDIGTAHVPMPAKKVSLVALPTVSPQLIALLGPTLDDLRVPLAGVGAFGNGAETAATDVELTAGCLVFVDVADFCFGDLA